jgi:nanoRNase/pAp phosphatase (c-di-AMP/oligoRNAs hydrolase)
MTDKLIQKITHKIQSKNIRSIAIVMHNKPDGDCLGSAVALEEALKK